MSCRFKLRKLTKVISNGRLCSHCRKPVASYYDSTFQTATQERRNCGTCSGAGGTSQCQRSPRHDTLQVTFAAKCMRPFCRFKRNLSLVRYVRKNSVPFLQYVARMYLYGMKSFSLFCDRHGFLAVCILTRPLSFVHLAESVISGRSFCVRHPPFVGKRKR